MRRVSLMLGAAVIALGVQLGSFKEHARALLFARSPLPVPSGRFGVAAADVSLPPAGPTDSRAELGLRIWYPTAAGSSTPWRDWISAPTRAPAHRDAPLAPGLGPLPVVLYAPSWFSNRDENSLRAAELASQGYAVVAFDDVVHDPQGLTGPEGPDRKAGLDFATDEALARTLPLANARVAREARKATLALDRLGKDARWSTRLALQRVAFLGFSFGGAAAAEASRLDERICAVINLDGWVFGEALRSGVRGPYLVLWSDFPIPFQLPGSPLPERALMNAYVAFERGQLQEPDKFGFKLDGVNHLDYSDRLNFPSFSELREPRKLDRPRLRRIVDAYVLEFLDVYLRGRGAPRLLRESPGPYPELHAINALPQ